MSSIVINNTTRTVEIHSTGRAGPAGLVWIDTGWVDEARYQRNQALEHDGTSYRALSEHIAAPETEPGTGVDWETVWQVIALGSDVADVSTVAGIADEIALVATKMEEIEAAPQAATDAENAADRAEVARDAATVNAEVYADTTAGLAATVEGEQFQVVSGDEIIRYRHDAGPVATEVARYPGAEKLKNIEDIARSSINLLDPDDPDYLIGYRNNPANGVPVAISGWETSGFIPVVSGQTYYTNLGGYGSFHNTSKAFVSAADVPPTWVAPVFTAPGDGFVRMSAHENGNHNKSQLFFVAASARPETFEPFGKVARESGLVNLSDGIFSDGAVRPQKTAFWKTGKNLANPVGRVDDFYMSTSGEPVANSTYSYWPMIKVTPGRDYSANQSMRFVSYFDIGGRRFGGITTPVTQFTPPDGAAYAVVTSNKSSVASFQLEEAATSSAFEAFRWEGRNTLPTGEPLVWGIPPGAGIVAAIDAELGSTDWQGASVRPVSYGLERLRETRQRLRSLRGGKTGVGARLTVSLIGDSYTHDNGRYSVKIARALWDKYHPEDPNVLYGPIGVGWVSFKGAGSGSFPNGAIYWNNYMTGDGTWTSENGTADSPDTGSETSSTPGDYLQPAVDWNYDLGLDYTLFAEGGSGEVRYRWTAEGAWTTVDLSALAAGVQTVAMTPPASGTGRFRIEVVSGTCKLYGIYQRHPTSEGVIVNKLGATGTRLQQWAERDDARWRTGFAALGSDLTCILHGTNDQNSRSKQQFKTDLLTMIDRIRTARPTTDILLIAPAENQRVNSLAMSDYAAAMYEVARDDRDVAYIDLQQAFGVAPADYAFGSARPWFASDGIHPDPNSGGWAMADAILSAIGERSA